MPTVGQGRAGRVASAEEPGPAATSRDASCRDVLEPGTLWRRVAAATARGLRNGALHPIPTRVETCPDRGIPFVVRVADCTAPEVRVWKDRCEDAGEPGDDFDPFLPCDEDLYVAPLSVTHHCVLNKFSVLDHHLLIVTASFEHQEELLTLGDFEALATCLAELGGLAFFNAGQAAGASQSHKHLQLLAGPQCRKRLPLPLEPTLARSAAGDASLLPFVHATARLDPMSGQEPPAIARTLLRTYHDLLGAVGLSALGAGPGERQRAPYNLLATRRWMSVVPRSREAFGAVSVNALGFAGSLLVQSEADLDMVRQVGPIAVLRHVAVDSRDS